MTHRVSRGGVVALLLGLGVAACTATRPDHATSPGAMPLEDLIRRHIEARGGEAAIEAIQSLEMDLRIVEPTFAVTGLYRVDRQGRMRIDIFSEGRRVFSESYDGSHGWQLPEDGPGPVPSEKGTAALRNSAQSPTKVLGLHEMEAHGHQLASAGREKIDGIYYHVVVLTLDDGQVERYYIDPRSFLITRSRAVRPLHPDIDATPTTIETVYSDFRKVSGVSFGYLSVDTDLTTGQVLQTTTLIEVRPNRPCEDACFRLLP